MTTKLVSEKLKKAVAICNRLVPLRPTLPVLANIYLKAEKTKLILVATNLESSVRLEIPASGEEWEFTVPGKIFGEFLNSTNANETVLEIEKETVKIAAGSMQATLSGIAATEFPKVPQTDTKSGIVFKQKELAEAVNSVAFAASLDEGKPVLNSLLIDQEEEKTILVATDGYRLAKKVLDKDYGIKATLVPVKVFPETLKIAAELEEETISLTIADTENQIIISGEFFQVATRLVDGVFPQFTQRIPTNFVTETEVAKNELTNVIKAVAVLARDTGNVVKIKAEKDKDLVLTASTTQLGDSSGRVAAATEGEDLTVAVNSNFLLAGLGAMQEETLQVKFSGVLSPIAVSGEKDKSLLYIVMPVKAQN